jgi:hypothetical protein
MIPLLTHPLALIALATLPALAAIYFLRNRFHRRKVSSLMLWRFSAQPQSGGAKVHRLQLPLLFFLELLALALLVIAAAGPRWQLPQSTRPLIVVLDDSLSLCARSAGVSAQDRAREYLASLYRHQAPPATRLILAGPEPQFLGDSLKTWREVSALLPQWRCAAPAAALDAAITLAAEVGQQQANILVLTDHKPADETISNPRMEWHAFGATVENVAIVNASRTALGDTDRCLLEIANFSPSPRASQLLVQTGSNAPQSSPLLLSARETKRVVFNLPANAPALQARLEDDALAEDNTVQLLPPIRKKVRVEVALADEEQRALANRTLDATGLRATLSAAPELVIHESDALTSSNAWSVNWTSTGTNVFTGPLMLDATHPLANGLSLEGTLWAGASLTNQPGDIPVILAGNIPLLTTRDEILGRRQLHLNFNARLSTVQNLPDWPVLWYNLLQWRIDEMPGLRDSNTRLGTEVRLRTAGDSVRVTLPDGSVKSWPKTGDEIFIPTPLPGIYTVALGTQTNSLAVNPLVADESDLSNCATGRWGQWSEPVGLQMQEASVVWVFGLLALGLLTLHLWLIASGKGAK